MRIAAPGRSDQHRHRTHSRSAAGSFRIHALPAEPFQHLFGASHAIFVRGHAEQVRPAIDEIPDVLRMRLLSVRAFDRAGMMVDADVVAGAELRPVLERLLAMPEVDYLHLHNAKPGCYAARAERA